MKKQFYLTLTLISLCGLSSFAQDLVKGKPGMWPAFIRYQGSQPAFDRNAVQILDNNGNAATLPGARVSQSETDNRGFEHVRYQQSHQGIPVEHGVWIAHVKNGRITSQNGKWVKDFPASLPTRASIASSRAIDLAKSAIGATKYKWELPDEEAFLKQTNPGASYTPKGQLVYYSGDVDLEPQALKLAWKLDIYAHEPLSRHYVYIDAITGRVLGKRSLIHETDAPGTAHTAYSGVQSITADNTGTNYRLRQTGRGNGIATYNLQKGTSYGLAVDFTDSDNIWNNVNANKDEYAGDAHWATEKTYDYYFTRFGRNSIDNNGFALNSYLHYSNNYFNAFWDGYRMVYGDGDATNGFRPLTSLDVCGHEITHGLTNFTSNLVYQDESGALNEAFSDIFGTAIEFYARPGNGDWLVGGDFYTIRSMSNPNAYSDPDTYEGLHWYVGSGDNGGVHTNSGVLNFWFYLLATGGSGVNDHNTPYNVTGIGIQDAAAIAYRLNTNYLYSTADYFTARVLGIQSAEDLFGVGSPQAMATADAFTAVGLYNPSCAQTSGIFTSSVDDWSAVLNWVSSPGALYYKVEFRQAGTTTWGSYPATTDTFKVVLGLSPNTTYEWRVRSSCNGTWTQGQFTSLPPICRVPSNLSHVVIDTTVHLNWYFQSYATGYTVRYKKTSDINWQETSLNSDTYFISGLLPNTTYDWQVRSNCTLDSSGWASAQFTTNTTICEKPANLAVDYLPALTTRLRWNAVPGAQQYHVQIQWPGDNWHGSPVDTLVSDTSLTIVGFMSGMNLEWRVGTRCGSNNSLYTQSTLSTPCPAPLNLTVSNITANTAQLNWVSGNANSMFGYTIQYKLSTATTWVTAATIAGTTASLSNLQQGKLYDVRVRQNCYNFNSAYAQTQFTTPCSNPPAGLYAKNVVINSAVVGWAAVTGAVSYTLQYKQSSASTWITHSSPTTTSVLLTPLNSATAYQFRVKTNCTVGSSEYSAPFGFSTYCSSSGNSSQEHIRSFVLGSISNTSGASGYSNTGLSTNLVIGSTNTAQIAAGFSSASRTENFAVYIDFNRNGNYNDVGERVAGISQFSGTTPFSFTITIPATATPGNTSMRVVMQRNGTATITPCNINNRGETEDYNVNLVPGAGFNVQTLPELTQVKSLQVSPNPSTGVFNIAFPDDVRFTEFELLNSKGTMIRKGRVGNQSAWKIDITGEAAGIYLLRFNDEQGRSEVVRLIKQ